MSSYKTKPKHVVGRCPVLGCKHVRIHFEEPRRMPAKQRAVNVLRRHVLTFHPDFVDAVTRAYIRLYCVR